MTQSSEPGAWQANPGIPELSPAPAPTPRAMPDELRKFDTRYEGAVSYVKLWNYWVRIATPVDSDDDFYYHDYESGSAQATALVAAIGVPLSWPRSSEEVWQRIATVWSWLAAHVRYDPAEYGTITAAHRWPSIDEFGGYWARHKRLVWSECFSKAHLFATLLGRVLPRWHVTILMAHHTESGAPPTASHVFVGVYVADRWYYLDPTWVASGALPDFAHRKSVGAFTTVDYAHPWSAYPVPTSTLAGVPLIGE